MTAAAQFDEAKHRRKQGKFTNKEQSAATTALSGPAPVSAQAPIMATATLQEWQGDEAVTIGEVSFDASAILAGMSDERRESLGQEPGDQDEIFEKAMVMGLTPRHDGPYEVDVVDSLDEALGANPAYFEREEEGTARGAGSESVPVSEDFDRSLPGFEGWPVSLAEPTLDFGVNDDGTIRTTLTVEGQGELDFYTDNSSGRTSYDRFEGNFDDVDEEVLEQAAEWASAKHEEIEGAVMAEMKTAALASRGRIMAGMGMKASTPSEDELEALVRHSSTLSSSARETFELANTALMARELMAGHPDAAYAEILVDEVDDGDVISGVSVMDKDREVVAQYSSSSGYDMLANMSEADEKVYDALNDIGTNPSNSYWGRFTLDPDPQTSLDQMHRDSFIIDLAAAAAWVPGT